jgi:hypothetical protein
MAELRIEAKQDDRSVRFEELYGQCQSDFEHRILKAIDNIGLPLPDEAQKTLYDGDEPIAEADFYYEPKIVVFVDGSPHYKDYIQHADQEKRRRLRALGYRPVAIESVEDGLDELKQRLKI